VTIEKLSPTKLQVFISPEDMKEWEIEPDALTYNSPEAQMLFNDVIMQAKAECGFVCDGANVVIEAIPNSDAGLKVVLTVVNETDDKHLPSPLPEGECAKSKMLILELADLEDVASACRHLLPVYRGKSHLFKYSGRYYIVLQANAISYSSIYDFGEIVDSPDMFFGYLNEYAEQIVKDNFLSQ